MLAETLRSLAKRLTEKSLRIAAARRQPRTRGRSLILAFHNVVPDGQEGRGDQSLHVPLSRFREYLDVIQDCCEVVTMEQIVNGDSAIGRPSVAVTFDDAYRGAVEYGLPELLRRDVPVVLFVAPGLLGSDAFWWDALAGPDGLSPSTRRAILERNAGLPPPVDPAAGFGWEPADLPDSYGCAGEDQVRAIAANRLLALGSHTWSHTNLARLEEEDLFRELSSPLEWLGSVKGKVLPLLAYPYGLTSSAVMKAAKRTGYSGALLVDGGWYSATSGAWAIPRYNVPAGLSQDGLFLRLAGVIHAGPRDQP